MPIKICSFFFILASLTGCYCSYHPTGLREAPVKAIENNIAFSIDSPAFEEGDWPSDRWWEFFNDPQLNILVETALACNPNIKIEEANAQLACYAAKMTKAALYPSLLAHGEIYRFRQSKTGIYGSVPSSEFPLDYTQTTALLDFEYELDFWKKRKNRYVAQLNEAQAAIAEIYVAQLMLSLAIAQAYFDYQVKCARINVWKQALENRQLFLNLLNASIYNGINSPYSALAVQKQIYAIEEVICHLSEIQQIDLNTIRELVALEFQEHLELTLWDIASLRPFPLPCDLPVSLLYHRPEIIAQQWRVDAARHEIYAAEGEFYPDINLSAITGFQTIKFGQLFNPESFYGYWGPAINLPLFDGGLRNANLGMRQQEYIKAASKYEKLVLKAVGEVLNGISSVQENKVRYEAAYNYQDATLSQYNIVQLRYENHLDNEFNVLEAQRNWIETQDHQLCIWEDYLQSQLSLFKALGGGFGCG